jgi:hypothetical protein
MKILKNKQKVVCIGLGKTGTTSFSQAMIELGYRHCGHGARLPKLGTSLGLDLGINLALRYYDSFDDFPWPYLYRKISLKYPNAKFVLTRRKSSEVWLKSLEKAYSRKGPTYEKFENYGYFSVYQNPQHHVRLYESHLNAVRSYFSGSPKLLEVCWEDGDGWNELCGFLGKNVPKTPFPIANKATKIDYELAREKANSELKKKLID